MEQGVFRDGESWRNDALYYNASVKETYNCLLRFCSYIDVSALDISSAME